MKPRREFGGALVFHSTPPHSSHQQFRRGMQALRITSHDFVLFSMQQLYEYLMLTQRSCFGTPAKGEHSLLKEVVKAGTVDHYHQLRRFSGGF